MAADALLTRHPERASGRGVLDARADGNASDEDAESDNTDELPAMVEKKPPLTCSSVPAVSTPASAPSSQHQLDWSVNGDVNDSLNGSLPDSEEPVRSPQHRKPRLAELVKSAVHVSKPPPLSSTVPLTAASEQVMPHRQQHTALHQQLIDRTLRHKRQELVTQAFVRWRRGLHIQSQRRQTRAQQLHHLRTRLVRRRRNRAFSEWRALASLSSQVLSCRVDAFQQRVASRTLVGAWARWTLRHYAHSLRRRQLLRNALRRLRVIVLQRALHSWSRVSRELQWRERLQQSQHTFARTWDERMVHVAQQQYAHRVAQRLTRVLRDWRSLTANRRQRRYVLRKLTLRRSARLMACGWRKWVGLLLLLRRQVDAAAVATAALDDRKKQREELTKEHELLRQQLEARDKRLQELHAQVRKRDADIQWLQDQQQQQQRESEAHEVCLLSCRWRLLHFRAKVRLTTTLLPN